jgi:hypothetical protein
MATEKKEEKNRCVNRYKRYKSDDTVAALIGQGHEWKKGKGKIYKHYRRAAITKEQKKKEREWGLLGGNE